MPTKEHTKTLRDMEQELVKEAYAEACGPENHIPECPPNNSNCPYRDRI